MLLHAMLLNIFLCLSATLKRKKEEKKVIIIA